jgi:hypothetical protein
MSDYLNNLVERTLKVAPVVQPRLASLFESGSNAGVEISRGHFETETNRNDSSSDAAFRAPAAAPQPVQLSQLRPPIRETNEINLFDRKKSAADPERGNQENSPAVIVHQPEPLPAARGLTTPVRPVSTEPDVARNDYPARAQTTEPAAVSESGQSSSIENDHEENWPRLQPRIRQLVDEQLTRHQPAHADGHDRTRGEQVGPVAVATSRVNTERADVAAIKATPHIIREPVVTTEPAPTINVTIGRIDVRAIVSQSSPAPRFAQPQQPRTSSLDEYLRKRNEGRR